VSSALWLSAFRAPLLILLPQIHPRRQLPQRHLLHGPDRHDDRLWRHYRVDYGRSNLHLPLRLSWHRQLRRRGRLHSRNSARRIAGSVRQMYSRSQPTLTTPTYELSYQTRERAILTRLRRRPSLRPLRHLSFHARSSRQADGITDVAEDTADREYEAIIEALRVEKSREFRAEVSAEVFQAALSGSSGAL